MVRVCGEGTSTRKQERSAKVTRCIKLITGVGKKIHAKFWFIYVVIEYSSLVGCLHAYTLLLWEPLRRFGSVFFFHLHCTDANGKCLWRKMVKSVKIEILCNYGNTRQEWAILEFKRKKYMRQWNLHSQLETVLCGRRAHTLHVRKKCTPPKWMQTKCFAGRNDCRKSGLFARTHTFVVVKVFVDASDGFIAFACDSLWHTTCKGTLTEQPVPVTRVYSGEVRKCGCWRSWNHFSSTLSERLTTGFLCGDDIKRTWNMTQRAELPEANYSFGRSKSEYVILRRLRITGANSFLQTSNHFPMSSFRWEWANANHWGDAFCCIIFQFRWTFLEVAYCFMILEI